MPVNSFGYQVMSLREMIEQLQSIANSAPDRLDKPVWIINIPPLRCPVKQVGLCERGTALIAEKG